MNRLNCDELDDRIMYALRLIGEPVYIVSDKVYAGKVLNAELSSDVNECYVRVIYDVDGHSITLKVEVSIIDLVLYHTREIAEKVLNKSRIKQTRQVSV